MIDKSECCPFHLMMALGTVVGRTMDMNLEENHVFKGIDRIAELARKAIVENHQAQELMAEAHAATKH
jgi:hypothetical protein